MMGCGKGLGGGVWHGRLLNTAWTLALVGKLNFPYATDSPGGIPENTGIAYIGFGRCCVAQTEPKLVVPTQLEVSLSVPEVQYCHKPIIYLKIQASASYRL